MVQVSENAQILGVQTRDAYFQFSRENFPTNLLPLGLCKCVLYDEGLQQLCLLGLFQQGLNQIVCKLRLKEI